METTKIQLDGKARLAGTLTIELMPKGQPAKFVLVDVIPGTDSKELARDLYKQMTLTLGSGSFKFNQSGDKVVIEKANQSAPAFSVRVVNLSILGMSVLID